MKKIVSCILAICIIISCMVCSAETAEVKYDQFAGTEITVAVLKKEISQCNDFNEMEFAKLAEAATGIHVNWVYVENGAKTEKVTAMLVGDMPDLFMGLVTESQIAANMDLFYDLSEEGLLDTYAFNIVKQYKDNVAGNMECVTWPDGSIRSLCTDLQTSWNNDGEGIMVINKKWLDQLNLKVPTTTDELYEALCAFRDNDMDGDGDPSNEIPFEFAESNWAARLWNLGDAFGLYGLGQDNQMHYYQYKDGNIIPTLNTQAFKDFLNYAHKLAAEGLLDVEGFSQTGEQYNAKLHNCVGVFFAWTPDSKVPAENARDYVVVRPVAAEGYTPVKSGTYNKVRATRTGLAISAKTEKIGAVLTWLNYLCSSKEMLWTTRLGKQGDLWDVDADGNIVNASGAELSSDFTEEDYKYTNAIVGYGPMISVDMNMLVNEDPKNGDYIRKLMVDEVSDMLPRELMPARFTDPEDTANRTFIEVDLFAMINNFFANSIAYGFTDDDWDKFQNDLTTYGYYDWIQWYQDFADGKI